MRTTPDRILALLIVLLVLAEPGRVSAQLEARPSTPLLAPPAARPLDEIPWGAAMHVMWQEARADAGSEAKASWAVVGFLGSVAGGWAGAHAGARLGLLRDSGSEDPELPGLILGAVVGSTLGAAGVVAAVDGRDGSFPDAFGGTVLGTIVGLIAAGTMGDTAGLLAFSLTQTLGAVLGAAWPD